MHLGIFSSLNLPTAISNRVLQVTYFERKRIC